jgi:hypothetical protein
MPEKNQNCTNCYFFMLTGTKPETEGAGEIGRCRANPPTIQYREDGRQTVGLFPIVLGGMWCGMWDARD